MADIADLIVESRTQSAETIQRVLEQSGHTNFEAHTHSDQPEPPAAEPPPADPPAAGAAAPAVAEPPAVDPKQATPPAPPASPEPTAAAPPAADAPPPAERKPSRGFKHKWERERAENERLKQQIEELKGKDKPPAGDPPPATPPAAAAPPAKPAADQPKPKPNPEDFDNGVYDPAYIEAVSDWKYDERRRLEREEDARNTREAADKKRRDADAADQQAFESWRKNQIEEARARHDDFDAVISKEHGELTITNPVMNEAMWSFDDGAELAYWLATHPEDAHRICELTAMREGETIVDFRKKLALAVRELGKIELPDIAETEEDEEEEPAAEPKPAAQQPRVAPPAPAAAPAPPAAAPAPKPPSPPRATPPPPPKPAPPSPVGSRGAGSKKRLSQMSTEELRKLSTDEWRRLKREEFGN